LSRETTNSFGRVIASLTVDKVLSAVFFTSTNRRENYLNKVADEDTKSKLYENSKYGTIIQ